jgi:eukaryotic-like serine/threonine-protein kinase
LFTAAHILQPEVRETQNHPLIRLLALSMVLVSAAFFALQRAGWVSKQTIVHLGGVFQVYMAFCIAVGETAMLEGPSTVVIGVSKVALWLILCGVLIPTTPLANLLAGGFCVLAWPAGYWTAASVFGREFTGWNRVSMWMAPLVLCGVWTYLINRRVYAMELRTQRVDDLGSYQLEYLIGQGGMGEVWRAKHRLLARDAAVKIIRPQILTGRSMRDESVIRKRFEREARATASLRSPHTVALFDFGSTKDGLFYYVMELLMGIDLQTLVARYGPMHPGRVLNILIQICESLEEAHRLSMVHRDVKPRNVFLSKLGSQHDFAKVLDFGLVKARFSEEESLTTLDGTATGTPAYMAPEIALGAKELDGRADIYALGCVAYFMLTGEMVFDEGSATAIALAHVQKAPVPPSQRTELPIPGGLEQVIMQCLEKDPEKRPRSAQELARRLEALNDVPRFNRDNAAEWWDTNLPMQDVQPLEKTATPNPVYDTARV